MGTTRTGGDEGEAVEAADETAGFAALLRELKDRSGLSYGALARRLHISTSTLHRYCRGEAVPLEYTPVERFARACRATPEELAELHRRWRLADEERGRRARPSAPPVLRETAPEENAPEENAPGKTAPGEPARTEPARAEPAAEGTGPAAAPESPERTPAPEPIPEPGPEPGPPAAPARAADGGPPRRGLLRGGRRTALLAGVSVVLVAGAAALAVQPLTGDVETASKRPAATATGDGRSDGPGPERTDRPASPSASRTGGANPSPSPSGSGGGDGPARDGGRPEPSATGAPGGVPLTVSVRPYAWESPCSQHYLVDESPSRLSPPPFAPEAPGWVAANGAVSADSQYVELTVQGTGEETVVLKDLHVRVADRKAPLAWNKYATGVGCGGEVSTQHFAVDLDAGRPDAVPGPGQRDFPYKVSEDDPEVFYVTASTDAHDVSWYLELEWSSGDRRGTLRVDDRGTPFRTSSAEGRPTYAYPLGSDGWAEEPAGE
ncbi:hypothetical protein GCM10010420_04040 [Streptomyces glaucosporus]|uniref:HTH cro/C1-type domain-containing protein n=1 Tax=Streptomyces glaucosporus TaxID=284044 RepID=A0ABP5UPV4_9ACTN